MSVATGTKLGPYEIGAPIGAGGMGEVYRARDTKLGRDVAVKVLPAAFVRDAERVSRFRREAQVLASLNHPNIAAIYGLEESGGVVALILELVEGEDLAVRLKRGAVPIDEAIAIAKQVAEGLEAAHEKGVVHRDLKPGNIKLSRNGAVKILDFGLAKAYEGEAAATDSDVSHSPTMSHHMTQEGLILGTAAYMSPEQARGKRVDKRADIWAYGVVLFEMLTGRRLFDGETVTDIVAAVLTREPDWTALPPSTPAGVQRLLKRCLSRDPKKRLRDIGDVYSELEETADAAPTAQLAQPRRGGLSILPWAFAVAALAMAAWLWIHRTAPETTSRSVMHMDVTYPPDVEPAAGLQGGFALSPDGRILAMIGVKGGVRKLYIRRLDRPDATELNDSGGVNSAEFSPDSASVAFVPASTQLMRVSLADQQRSVVEPGTDLTSSLKWATPGILFTRGGALWLVPAQGGDARQLTTLDPARHEVVHGDPLVLPSGHTVLFSCLTSDAGTERIEAVSIQGGKRRVIVDHASTPAWSPTGHLLFGREGALWAEPFDPDKVQATGNALPVIPAGVIGSIRTGSLGYMLSETGTLVYDPANFDSNRVISVGRDGSELAMSLPPSRYGNPRISPDGHRLLIESAGSVVQAIDLSRGTSSLIAAAAIGTSFSSWTSDGERVVFRRFNIPFWVAADGSGKAGAVPHSLVNDYPAAPGPEPDSIIGVRIQPKTSGDIFLFSLSGKFEPKPLLMTGAYEGGPQLSPDERWLLYQSNESGQAEIYVRRFPALDRQWQVSEGGGVQTRWSTIGREIFYRNGRDMMAVAFDPSGAEPTFGKPTALFTDEYDFGQGISIPNYDVTHDGRFMMFRRGTQGNTLRVVINWTEELKQILAAGGVR